MLSHRAGDLVSIETVQPGHIVLDGQGVVWEVVNSKDVFPQVVPHTLVLRCIAILPEARVEIQPGVVNVAIFGRLYIYVGGAGGVHTLEKAFGLSHEWVCQSIQNFSGS